VARGLYRTHSTAHLAPQSLSCTVRGVSGPRSAQPAPEPTGSLPELHPYLEQAFGAFEQAGVRWALMRGDDQLADPVGDVDLFVADTDLDRVASALRPLGFVHVPAWGRGSHRFFVGYEAMADRWLELDVVTELAYGPSFAACTGAEEGCLARTILAGTVRRLDPDDAFWTRLLHCILDRGSVPARHAEALGDLRPQARTDGQLATWVDDRLPPGWDARRVLEASREEDWARLLDLRRPMLRRAASTAPLTFLGRTSRVSMQRRTRRVHTALRRRGLRVALLGPDGAGKSTLADGLSESFYFPVRTFYAGLSRRPVRERRLVPGMRLAALLARLRWLSLTAAVHQASGRLVIFDRYTYDALNQPSPTRPLRFRRWLLAHACRPADLALLLDAPGDIMHQRKAEFEAAALDDQRRRFLELVGRVSELVVLDAAQSGTDVRRAATALIWQRYADRFGRRAVS
jgi:thymidylate kinase